MGFLHFSYSAYYGCKTGVLPCSNKAMVRGKSPHRNMVPISVIIFYSCLVLHTISATTELIKDPDGSLFSKNRDFKLGFFSTNTSQLRYLGIWYNKVSLMDYDRYIWVANRNNPLNDSSGVLILSQDGNLQLLNGKKSVMWTSNVPQMMPPSATRKVVLSDFGNLCLMEYNTNMTGSDSNGTIIWQTFRNPTDSIVANMTLRMTSLNMKNALQSWKTPSDPSYGRYTLGTDSLTHPQIVIWDVDRPIWRSGPWNGNIFLGLLYSGVSNDYADTSVRQTEQGEADLVYTGIKKVAFSHYKFSYDGVLNELYWDEGNSKWVNVYHAPDDKCDFYNVCGAFASCNSVKSQMCRCLRGFRPRNAGEWSKRNWSGGCVRHVPLQCGTGGGKSQEEEGFLRLKRVKGPDLAEWVAGVTDIQCRSLCLANCSCLAYAYDVGAGCMYWSRDLVDIQELSSDGVDLYIRLPKSELGKKHLSKGAIAGLVVAGMVTVAIILCLLWWCKGRRKEKEAERNILALEETQESPDELSQGHRDDLPLLKYANLVDATDNFHERNKLGKGGFGEVYKGKLKDGQEIAVKRLSACSGQGIKEFTNEVVVISKLQHRNLVRLVGFCTKGEEKMLVYEYMPNKSLDAFLFDSMKREILDWGKRFNIIQGICRGLIYLHRDSRLRIIHRDLKASNILLDEDLNPKISDFGMARIFMNNQDEDETKRVVGTYGYMAPEYAMEGQFSEKSDVYSFGVLVVEIVTAQKNNTFWIEEDALSLLGYAWKLWTENNLTLIIDPNN